jgi:hypothetical protein
MTRSTPRVRIFLIENSETKCALYDSFSFFVTFVSFVIDQLYRI